MYAITGSAATACSAHSVGPIERCINARQGRRYTRTRAHTRTHTHRCVLRGDPGSSAGAVLPRARLLRVHYFVRYAVPRRVRTDARGERARENASSACQGRPYHGYDSTIRDSRDVLRNVRGPKVPGLSGINRVHQTVLRPTEHDVTDSSSSVSLFRSRERALGNVIYIIRAVSFTMRFAGGEQRNRIGEGV